MVKDLLHKGFSLLLRQQTNILSAAFIIMSTVVLSQLLGLIRQRLLVSIFGATDTVGIYLVAQKPPDILFQLTIASALTTAFIPVFSDLLAKERKNDAHTMASAVITIGTAIYIVLALIVCLFAPFFLQLFNLGQGYSPEQMTLMANLTRILTLGQILFIIGSFFTVFLQSYNHFFIPGIAAAMYNLGIILGLLFLSPLIGIYSAAIGVIIGALIFILLQIPLVKKIGFSYTFNLSLKTPGVMKVVHLM